MTTAFLWTISALCWASAGRRIGSLRVNLLRLILAPLMLLALLPVYALWLGHWPAMLSREQFFWVALSGIPGIVIGDALYFEAIVLLGARRAVQINTLAPVAALIAGWLWLGETLKPISMWGAALVLASVAYLAWIERRPGRASQDAAARQPGEPSHLSLLGLFCAVAAATGIGLGTVVARRAYSAPLVNGRPLDSYLAATIRVVAASLMFWIYPLVRFRAAALKIPLALGDRIVRSRLLLGTAVGPVIGMVTYLVAIEHAPAGLVATLVAMSPVFLLPIVVMRYRLRFTADVYVATAAALAGVALIFSR